MPLKIYTSSAGSGKTYTLVREYIALIIADPNAYRHILAITFTNKATDEMKSRIIAALSSLAAYVAGESHDPQAALLANDLLARANDPAMTHPRLRARAEQALYNILHHYGEFSISTIDSFFQKILRHFAKELKIPMRYELEMNTSYAVEQVVARLMTDIGKVAGLTEWLEQYTFAKMDDDEGWKIEQGINELSKEIFREQIWEYLAQGDRNFVTEQTAGDDAILMPNESNKNDENNTAQPTSAADNARNNQYQRLQKFIVQLHTVKRDVESQMAKFGAEAMELIAGYGLTPKDFKPGTANWFEKIQQKDYSTTSTLCKIIAGKTAEWRAQKAPQVERIDQLVGNGLQALFLEAVQFIETEQMRYVSAIEVLKSIYSYGILGDVREKLKDYRSENNTMLIADTNNILRAIISQEDAPFIFEKVGTVYHHLLIDEFQDTSDFQWLNLLPLINNSLSTDNRVLVVGDAKQSIYRWRSGNMKLLLSGISEQLPHFFDADTQQNLADNYRSQARIVEFNNTFFATAAQTLLQHADMPAASLADLELAYQAVQQGIIKKGGGYVEINFIDSADNSDNDSSSSENNPISHSKTSWQAGAEQRLLDLIGELCQQGFAYKDIAILTRRNTEGSQIAQLLAAQNIRVISSESLLLATSPKVQLLISALQFIADRRHHISRAELLVNYQQLFPDAPAANDFSYHQLCTDHRHYINHVMPTRQQTVTDTETINSSIQQAIVNDTPIPATVLESLLPAAFTAHIDDFAARNLYDCVETLIQAFELAPQADAYLQRFQDLALEHTTRKNTDLRSFLAWWHDNETKAETSIIVPAGEDAVTIMTVHKAKGLEFPVVMMPFCEWSFTPKSGTTLWAQTDQEPFGQWGIMPLKSGKNLEKTHFAPAYYHEKALNLIDNINLLYVAFTRPTQRLYVMTKAIKNADSEIKSASQLLYKTLCNFDYVNEFDIPNGIFAHGIPEAPTHTNQTDTQPLYLQYPISRDYADAIAIRSDSQRYAAMLDSRQSEAIRIGQKVHVVLEKLIRPIDLDKILRQLQTKGIIDQADLPLIRQRIEGIFALPQVQQWFDHEIWDEVLCEQTMLYNEERKIPDRIMIKNKRAVIVDYKTGRRNDEKYSQQLKGYARRLRRMGYSVSEQYLLYIGELSTEIVPCHTEAKV